MVQIKIWFAKLRHRSLQRAASRMLLRSDTVATALRDPAVVRWCARSPQHARAFREMVELLRGVDTLQSRAFMARQAAQDDWQRTPPATGPWAIRSAQAALASLILLAAFWGWRQIPINEQTVATQLGEQRTLTLADGSRIMLNTATRLTVRSSRDGTRVLLESGEAAFEVTPQRQTFSVKFGVGEAQVLGTQFSVRRDAGSTTVAVESGRVQVRGDSLIPWLSQNQAILTAGRAVRISGSAEVGEDFAVDADRLTAWRHGRLVFDETPLADVVAEVRRYRSIPIDFADTEAGRLRLSGAYELNHLNRFFEVLPKVLPVEIHSGSQGAIMIARRH